jgi:hypothetical protein
MTRWQRRAALGIALVAAGVMMATTSAVALQPLRLIVGVPIVFALSGAAILWAAVPELVLTWVERGVASIGISLAVAIASWVLVGSTPIGLTRVSVAVALGGITVVAAVVALLRTRVGVRRSAARVNAPIRPVALRVDAPLGRVALAMDRMGARRGSDRKGSRWSFRALPVLVAGVLVCASIGLAVDSTLSAQAAGYNSLWIVPTFPGQVRVGVTSHELHRRAVRVSLEVSGVVRDVWSGVSLGPGQTWSRVVDIPKGLAQRSVEAKLFTAEGAGRYLTVDLG